MLLGLFVFIAFLGSATPANAREVFDEKKLPNIFNDITYNDKEYISVIRPGKGLILPVEATGTQKGNGTLQIHNVYVRFYDQHDDGLVYRNGILELELKDINNDGVKDVFITGVLKFTGEKENEVASYKNVVAKLLFNCEKGIFEKSYLENEKYIDLRILDVKPVLCK